MVEFKPPKKGLISMTKSGANTKWMCMARLCITNTKKTNIKNFCFVLQSFHTGEFL